MIITKGVDDMRKDLIERIEKLGEGVTQNFIPFIIFYDVGIITKVQFEKSIEVILKKLDEVSLVADDILEILRNDT